MLLALKWGNKNGRVSRVKKTVLSVLFLFLASVGVVRADSEPIVVYDIKYFNNVYQGNKIEFYDRMLAIESLQGVVNRNKPRLFLDMVTGYDGAFQKLGGSGNYDFDMYWFNKMCSPTNKATCVSTYPQLNGRPIVWLGEKTTPVEKLINDYYKNLIKGLVVWDKRVNATSLAALSIAGAEDYVAVRSPLGTNNQCDSGQESLLKRIKLLTGLMEKINLCTLNFTNPNVVPGGVIATGSTKNNAYRWLIQNYLANGKLSPDYIGYQLDAFATEPEANQGFFVTRTSHFDFLVAKKALFFDLSPWGDEKPSDDLSQPMGTDLATWKLIMQTANTRSPNIKKNFGYIPWPQKYAKDINPGWSKHGAVEGEHEHINLFSENGYVTIDTTGESGCCGSEEGVMPNASFYTLLRNVDERQFLNDEKNPPPPPKALENKTYLLFTYGDNASGGWIYKTFGSTLHWENAPGRGIIPIMWGFPSGIFEVNPVVLDEIRKTRTPKDYFGGYTAGIGYYNPNLMPKKALMSQATKMEYQQLNFNMTGFVIFTDHVRSNFPGWFTPEALGMVKSYSGRGIGTNETQQADIQLSGNVSVAEVLVYLEAYHPDADINHFVAQISSYDAKGKPGFVMVRALYNTPQQLVDTYNVLRQRYPDRNYEAVDPYTFFNLIKTKYGGNNNFKESFLSDTIPKKMEAGKTYNVEVVARNDGGDTWVTGRADQKNFKLGKSMVRMGMEHTVDSYNATGRAEMPAGTVVGPGHKVEFSFAIKAPATTGKYSFQYDMMQELTTFFYDQGNIPFTKTIEVVAATVPTVTMIPPIATLVPKNPGDATGDGKVDIDDFLRWKAEYLSQLTTKTADFNKNGTVDTSDFLRWKVAYLEK